MGQVGTNKVTGLALFLVAFGAALWGTDALLRKPLVDTMSSTSVVFAEHLFLALYAVPALIAGRSVLRTFRKQDWLALLVIAWGGSALATVLFTEGFGRGNPTTVILLQKVQPLIAVSLAAAILKERLPRLYWPCFAVAAVGTYLVSFGLSRPWTLGPDQIAAAGFALSAAALWGGSTVMGRFLLSDVTFATLTGLRFLFALPALALLAVWKGDFVPTFTGIAVDPLRVFLLALIPGLLAMLLYYRGLSGTRASYATLAELAYPATAMIVNWIFLNDPIKLAQFVGFILLWLAITALGWIPSEKGTPKSVAVATS